jgi:hypothetical protein
MVREWNKWIVYREVRGEYEYWDEVYFLKDMDEDSVSRALEHDYAFPFTIKLHRSCL